MLEKRAGMRLESNDFWKGASSSQKASAATLQTNTVPRARWLQSQLQPSRWTVRGGLSGLVR
jgi:hypothetical protein